jgi:CRP-like cAMP-binding protein
MQNPLVLKLKKFADLSDAEVSSIERLAGETCHKESGDDIVRQGDKPETVSLILDGIACRYKLSEEGERQIVGMMVPGDLCDLHAFILNEMDHSIAALTSVVVTQIDKDKLLGLFDSQPRITRALWWSTLVDEGTLREWVMNIATRSAYEGLAHLLSEICMRLKTVGLASSTGCSIKMRHEDLADTVGIGRPHASVSMARLKSEGLIEFSRGTIQILDIEGLMAVGKFNEHYLHLHKE